MRKWSQRDQQAMEGVHADLRLVLDAAKKSSPVDFDVIEGVRTRERQAALFAKGASKTLDSRHITGHAVDLWPVNPETGMRARNDDALLWSLLRPIAGAVKTEAGKAGVAIEWGGDWRSFPDGPHFQLSRDEYPAGEPARKPAIEPAIEPAKEPAAPSFWARVVAFIVAAWKNRKEPNP